MEQSLGAFLREKRLQLNLAQRDVQDASRVIADHEEDRRFIIGSSRLTQIESDLARPSLFKMFTLATVYGLDFVDMLKRYGVDPDRIHRHRARLKLAVTRPVSANVWSLQTTVTVPLRLDPSFKWFNTQLINRAVAQWGEIPAAFLLELSPTRHMYGYIGLEDKTMLPLLRPGSLVMIDGERRRVAKGGWTNEYERPIYFVELRDGYRCGWCELNDNRLTLIPHPASGSPVEVFNSTTEAEVIGQVVGVAMRLVPPTPSSQVHNEAPLMPS